MRIGEGVFKFLLLLPPSLCGWKYYTKMSSNFEYWHLAPILNPLSNFATTLEGSIVSVKKILGKIYFFLILRSLREFLSTSFQTPYEYERG